MNMFASRTKPIAKTRWLIFGLSVMAAPAPAAAQTMTAESLAGSTIVATVNYDVRWRRGEEQLSGPGSVTYQLNIGANGPYTGSVTRSNARAGATSTEQFSGTLGRGREVGGRMSGHSVWILSGNSLRMLRTYEVGGKTTVITFGAGGRSCSVRSPFARETGAGSAIRRGAIGSRGGTVEILSARQTSSSCQVRRT